MSSFDMHDGSVTTFLGGMRTLSGLLSKAKEFVDSGRMSEMDLIEFRLAPDMDPFRRQIQHAGDTAKACVMRLAGRSVPTFKDDETSLHELQERIVKTEELLRSVTPEELQQGAQRIIKLNVRRRWIALDGRAYVIEYGVPNFFFHVTTVYAILRHIGLKIGKLDYLVDFASRREGRSA